MGQRLVITFYKNKAQEKPFASIYYHWSAYSLSALEELDDLLDESQEFFLNKDYSDKTWIPYLCSKVSGVTYDDVDDYINQYDQNYSENTQVDRNNGILAISDSGIENHLFWSEGTLLVYLEEETFDFTGLMWEMDRNDFKEYLEFNAINSEDECDIKKYDLENVDLFNHTKLTKLVRNYDVISFDNKKWSVIA